MSKLISPANKQPCEFVAAKDGFICLRMDYVTPQVRWFTLTAIERVNPVATCALPPIIVVEMPAGMAKAINYTKGVKLVNVSLYADGLRVA